MTGNKVQFGEFVEMDDLRGGRMVFAVCRDEVTAMAVASGELGVDPALIAPWPIHTALRPEPLGTVLTYADSNGLGADYVAITKSLDASKYAKNLENDPLFLMRVCWSLVQKRKAKPALKLDKDVLLSCIADAESQNDYGIKSYELIKRFFAETDIKQVGAS